MPEFCPICSETVPSLSAHVWYRHVSSLYCWCGVSIPCTISELFKTAATFERHCEERGGYLAHYLECRLGGEDGEL
jgi:hypothetical protein